MIPDALTDVRITNVEKIQWPNPESSITSLFFTMSHTYIVLLHESLLLIFFQMDELIGDSNACPLN